MQCMQEIKNLTYSWLAGIKLPSVAEVQPSSHWCVVCWLRADPPWCSWWSGRHQVTVPLLGGAGQDWADPRLGVDSLFLVAGAGVDVLVSTVVLSLVSPSAQIVGTTTVFANRELSPRLSPDPVQVWPALFQLY